MDYAALGFYRLSAIMACIAEVIYKNGVLKFSETIDLISINVYGLYLII